MGMFWLKCCSVLIGRQRIHSENQKSEENMAHALFFDLTFDFMTTFMGLFICPILLQNQFFF